MHTCIRDLVVVDVAFIHDKHEIEVHCAAMGACEIVVVSSLQLLHDLI